MIRGVQRKGIASAIKHFVTNDMEDERKAVNNIVSDRALREIYLLPFQIAMRDAQPWCIMTAYNRLNGVHVSEKRDLLQGVLREEWRWDGALISDWYGTYSTAEAANAGLDLEMPGPTMWRAKLLSNAVGARKVSLQTIDKRARAVLELVGKVKQSGVKENAQEGTINTKEQAKLLRKLSADSIVLLQNNDGILPLSQGRTVSIHTTTVTISRSDQS
jgi:beta-glucosidase